MGKLIYSMITSLDGYVRDRDGNFGWGAPEQESHEFLHSSMQSVGTYLMGRRMYETMVYWETAHLQLDQPQFVLDFARTWQAATKIVYSTTLQEVSSERTRIERTFDPVAVQQLKADSPHDLTIDGPELAAQALRAGLVDEIHPIIGPAIVGGGLRFLPDDVQLDLQLLDQRFFGNGVVYLRYGVKGSTVA